MNFQELVIKYLKLGASEAEKKELGRLLENPENQLLLAEMIDRSFADEVHHFVHNDKGGVDSERIYQLIKPKKVVKMKWWWAAAAASVLIMLSIWFFNREGAKTEVPRYARNDKDVEAPKETKATITLANGKVITPIIKDGKVDIVKETEYNILSNPRGSKVVNLTLSDGTMVWLNAESSIKYPVVFTGERKIELSGEGYFEVKKPGFKVVANGIEIEDLGTEFNVNSYDETVTTLVKGKVKIGDLVMKPGDQASDQKLAASGVDLDDVTAWKNGRFSYKGADIETIMKEVARWYDVEVEYEGTVNEKFYADVSRETNVSTLFKILEATKAVRFKIDNKKIIVMQ